MIRTSGLLLPPLVSRSPIEAPSIADGVANRVSIDVAEFAPGVIAESDGRDRKYELDSVVPRIYCPRIA